MPRAVPTADSTNLSQHSLVLNLRSMPAQGGVSHHSWMGADAQSKTNLQCFSSAVNGSPGGAILFCRGQLVAAYEDREGGWSWHTVSRGQDGANSQPCTTRASQGE